MSKSVGYGVVGLAAVLLGVLIIVPFVKGFFVSQIDGYVDYPASLLTHAGANAQYLNWLLSVPKPELLKMQSEVQNLPVTTPEEQKNKPLLLGLITLAINALSGDANSNMIVKKIVSSIPAAVPVAPVGQVAPVTAGQVVPSLSVNVAKQSATLDLLKSACQSLLSETAAPLTGVATPSTMNTTAPVAAPPAMAMPSAVAAPPAMAMPSAVAAPTMSSMPPDVAMRKSKK